MRFRILIIAITALWQAALGFNADSLEVSFVNFYPGPDIYELEGHSALHVRMPGGYDAAISYGTFDFEQPHFVYRFVKGETDYWVSEAAWEPFAAYYKAAGRRIVEHPVLMDSVQKTRFAMLLIDNLQPQNRTYRYNYVKDNCATRPLRLIEAALGDSIVLGAPTGDAANSGSTFRQIMRFYHRHYPWYQFGIDLALGSGLDYPLADNEKAFAPAVLDTQLASATAGGRKLTGPARVIYPGHDATAGPTPWWLTPLAVFTLLFVLVAWLAARDMARVRVTRWADAALFGVFGLLGLVLTFLIFVSTHEATSPNWLYLWLNPLCLIVPIFIWLKKCNKLVFAYQIINFALLIVLAAAWSLTGQSGNMAFLPLIGCDAALAFRYIYVFVKKKQTYARH